MSKLKKIAYPVENNQFIYVPKRAIDLIYKTAIITNQYTVGGKGGKLVIEYQSKSGGSHGVMEINDMGPDEPKNKKKN
ncbi:hypothetical protein [Clostridium magnum]|uniref:Uncharacterized protein n=1 Tax=Clostridium magnum DSM 2767 TaxID=1121326 RepID=A0A162UVT4_9CLOT|nr:hypothetical protein [Clostridium magnum]KZL94334.1 hypothetical protein CLMAG_13870 [Clostridium magnum DSM 2767]SHJ54575.1 hypothetical protein SAMN02745944_06134 [Clostridium magnum DSM 2767]